MIFLLVTFLAWAILSVGMVGVDQGYATWSKSRLHTAAQALALFPLSRGPTSSVEDSVVLKSMGIPPSTVVERLYPSISTTQVRVSQDIKRPFQALMIHNYFNPRVTSENSLIPTNDINQKFATVKREESTIVMKSVLATLRPARQVGVYHLDHQSMPGALPCVLERTYWETLQENKLIVVTLNPLGEILAHDKKVGQFGPMVTSIGEDISAATLPIAPSIRMNGYVPIVQRIGTRDRVVGFGYAQIHGDSSQLAIRKRVKTIASPNATTQLTRDLSHLKEEEVLEIFEGNRTLQGAILAPTLMS